MEPTWYEDYSKLRTCSHRFCLRLISPKESSRGKKRERANTLCKKHKQQLELAVSKMFNDWCRVSTPRGHTPSNRLRVKANPQSIAQKIRCAAPKRKTSRDSLNEATRQRQDHGRQEVETYSALISARNGRTAQQGKYPDKYAQILHRWDLESCRSDLFNLF